MGTPPLPTTPGCSQNAVRTKTPPPPRPRTPSEVVYGHGDALCSRSLSLFRRFKRRMQHTQERRCGTSPRGRRGGPGFCDEIHFRRGLLIKVAMFLLNKTHRAVRLLMCSEPWIPRDFMPKRSFDRFSVGERSEVGLVGLVGASAVSFWDRTREDRSSLVMP